MFHSSAEVGLEKSAPIARATLSAGPPRSRPVKAHRRALSDPRTPATPIQIGVQSGHRAHGPCTARRSPFVGVPVRPIRGDRHEIAIIAQSFICRNHRRDAPLHLACEKPSLR